VRFLHFPKKAFQDKSYERKVRRYIWLIVLITTAPSVYLAYRIVDKSIFENNAEAFVQNELRFKTTQVISKTYKYSNSQGHEIDLLLLGTELSKAQLDTLKTKLPDYKLDRTVLNIRQGLNAKNEIDLSQIKASILETVYQSNPSERKNGSTYTKIDQPIPDLKAELRSLYPQLNEYSISHVEVHKVDTTKVDTITMMIADFSKPLSAAEQRRMNTWLKNRLQVDSLRVIAQAD
jgi:hypothetical protein